MDFVDLLPMLGGLPFVLSFFVFSNKNKRLERYLFKHYPKVWNEGYSKFVTGKIQNIEMAQGNYFMLPKVYLTLLQSSAAHYKLIFSKRYDDKGKIREYRKATVNWLIITLIFFFLFPLFAGIISYLTGQLVY